MDERSSVWGTLEVLVIVLVVAAALWFALRRTIQVHARHVTCGEIRDAGFNLPDCEGK